MIGEKLSYLLPGSGSIRKYLTNTQSINTNSLLFNLRGKAAGIPHTTYHQGRSDLLKYSILTLSFQLCSLQLVFFWTLAHKATEPRIQLTNFVEKFNLNV